MTLPRKEDSKAFLRVVSSDAGEHVRSRTINVLVMGPDVSKRSPGARLRRKIIDLCNLEGLSVKPEHKDMLAAIRHKLRGGFNLVRAEEHMAKRSHVIVVIPASAGSIAELGYFALRGKRLCSRMVILFDRNYQNKRNTYIAQGPGKAARQSRALVHYLDYDDIERAWSIIRREIENARADKADPTP